MYSLGKRVSHAPRDRPHSASTRPIEVDGGLVSAHRLLLTSDVDACVIRFRPRFTTPKQLIAPVNMKFTVIGQSTAKHRSREAVYSGR
jgi:hypothetical protein